MKWQPSAVALFALLSVALGGCSVGPVYKRPDIAAPAHWHESAVAGASESVWPAADWWRGFGSPQLDALIAEAERSNDDLAGAIARVQEADAQVRIAGAAMLPSLDAGATATRERATLVVFRITVAATVLLYIEIPKGFFPQQDTGIISGLSDAPQDISFAEMVRRQHALLDVVAKDPDVASYGTGLGGSRI